MSPDTTPQPLPDEVERHELAAELDCYLNPLVARCDELEAAPALSTTDQLLLDQLTGALGALYRYDQATDRLLDAYRLALEHAGRPAPEPVPTLEEACLCQLTPTELLAYRQADPVYRLGCVRGYRNGVADTERKYQALSSRYAQHAVLVPPPGYRPSPLLARLRKWLAGWLMSGPTLPAATRRQLLTHTPTASTPTASTPARHAA